MANQYLQLIPVLCLAIIFNALGFVQYCMLYNRLQFVVVAKIKIPSIIISSLAAIAIANHSAGVWTLIAQQVLIYFIKMVIFTIHNRYIRGSTSNGSSSIDTGSLAKDSLQVRWSTALTTTSTCS